MFLKKSGSKLFRAVNRIYRMVIKFGFMEDPDVTEVLRKVDLDGKKLKPEQMSFFFGREKLIATNRPGMAIWREKLICVDVAKLDWRCLLLQFATGSHC